MDKEIFEHEMNKAKAFIIVGDRVEYWHGYRRGLRRRYHGENFETLEMHHLWLTATGDETRDDRVEGYRDGYGCTQNNGQCMTCSLVNYGMDCNNFKIG